MPSLLNFWSWRSRADAADEFLAGPIRGELLGAEHLAARARAIARDQQVVTGRRPLRAARLLARLAETRGILAGARERLMDATAAGIDEEPAATWLLDNYYVLQEHLQEVRASLPGGYYRQLPELMSGPLTGYPRVYEIAITLISHTEARIDLEHVEQFVSAFQSVTPLTVGELWAIPAMLRIGLIESVRRMALRTTQRLDEIARATAWTEHIVEANARGGSALRAALRRFAEADHEVTPNFAHRLMHGLRHAAGASPPLAWVEHWIHDAGLDPREAVALSTQRMALTQIMMANSITSLREIGRRDWRAFVERQSLMESILREDPSGCYPQMTFATRDRYRHVVERIARGTTHREQSVAQWALDLARRAAPSPADASQPTVPHDHVGYWLIDDGRDELERIAGYRPALVERFERAVRRAPDLVFIGGLALCTTLATLAAIALAGEGSLDTLWIVLLFTFLPALDIAITVLNQLLTIWLPPHVLPRLDFQGEPIPPAHRTVVVVPTLFGSIDDVRDALEHLEVQFLANRGARLQFAILSDFTDAPAAQQPGDDAIVAAAQAGIRELNARYADEQRAAFFLLHRARLWNAQEGVWMGWERKRGKLVAFNQLLHSGDAQAFAIVSAGVASLQGTRYVITLDADTTLPSESAPALIGAMAHPLNRALLDETRTRVMRGFGILQPRVGISIPSANRTRFAMIASGHPGVDPYTTAVSDVYQDLFGEGSFTGKGIYDVDAFVQATTGRFPDNTLLSHDLIEGNYARAGLATDVIVYDDYPATYVAWSRRKHRWIRGDWQLLPWLRRYVPHTGGRARNDLSVLSRWKILDNLRRSVTELAQLLLFVGAWTVLPGSTLRWTLLGVGAVIAPWATSLALAIVRPPRDKSWRAYYTAIGHDAAVSVRQAVIALMVLPHQAMMSVDAIARTLYRLLVSQRHLLEWLPHSMVERSVNDVTSETWRAMRGATALTGAAALGLSWITLQRAGTPGAFDVRAAAVPLIALWSIVTLWLCAPWRAVVLSRAATKRPRILSASAREAAMRYARAHWTFFERFVSAETHWLAPDNFQADPEPVVAMRTSPTNMGLQLLATVSAHDLGFIDVATMTSHLERAFDTFDRLSRYRGHFHNWYDLHDLHVLEPPYVSTVDSGNIAGHLVALRQACLALAAREDARGDTALTARLAALAERALAFVMEMDFSFLYDPARELFTIGYHPLSFTADASHYDLLASEARLASYLAVARDVVPVEHWFRMSRTLTRAAGTSALVSWSGSMFEYLMPLLVMRSWPYTLLEQSYEGAVKRQIRYGQSRDVPWGVSESAYNIRDRQLTYQYRAFGVDDLALKRGLWRDLVIAPYATALAAMVDPAAALANLRTLESMGALAEYGFCDAIDYTRPDPDRPYALVRAYMAHHIGMSLVAFTNVLRENVWQDRFHADTLVQSAELLLHERVPRRLFLQEPQATPPVDEQAATGPYEPIVRTVDTAQPTRPRVALLGAVPYSVVVAHNGTGYSRYEDLAVTRWRSDRTRNASGQFCFVRDLTSGAVWSAAIQPYGAHPRSSHAHLALDRVTFERLDGDIETRTDITVVPADAAEVRRVTLTNRGRVAHEIELTSYGEVVMAPHAADRAHPAFSNLFVETEFHPWCQAITATRRPRSPDDPRLYCVHVIDTGSDRVGAVTCETDRARFIGRGRSLRDAAAMDSTGPLSGTTGAVLDPIIALRTRVRVEPGQFVRVGFTTLVAGSRQHAFELADRYHDSYAVQRAFDFAWTATQVEMQELGIDPESAVVFQELAAQLLFSDGSLRPPLDEIERNTGSQPRLWSHGVSGDLPIVLATIDDASGMPTLRELLVAHRYWSRRGLVVDLVIITAQPHDYLEDLRARIMEAMVVESAATPVDRPGGVFLRRRDMFNTDDYLMLSASARMHVACDGRSLTRILASADERQHNAFRATGGRAGLRRTSRATPMSVAQVERGGALSSLASLSSLPSLSSLSSALRPLVPSLRTPAADGVEGTLARSKALRFDNGIGGLDADGVYEMLVDDAHLPPAPWVNVIANAHGGFIVSERGAGCTWAENAYFYRLTPWHNDPVGDPISDLIYLQDAASGAIWSATPAPMHGGTYRVRHAPGVTTFEHVHDGVRSLLTLGVPADAAAKVSLLRVQNESGRERRILVTPYVEWTLGVHRDDTQHQVHTRFDVRENAMIARNYFDVAFRDWTAFLATSEPVASFTAGRRSFIGRDGDLARPAGLTGAGLDGVVGAGLDPCAALQMEVVLAPGESREIAVVLGAARSEMEALRLVRALRTPAAARDAVLQTTTAWTRRLSTITVRTPDAAFDAMIGQWALYQALGCRMWARSALYQSSGAYGFRDQLQDVMAFLYSEPDVARAHILRAASRQFVEGDVQHWWHPHTGRGVRTRFSDDLAWLPFVVDRYVHVTGDASVLDEEVPFLVMRTLGPDEHELYDLPTITHERASVYEHCCRAIRRACTAGAHGLPLIGIGDWNDGMNRVGVEGHGESVWLAWFLVTTLRAFAPYADARGDHSEATYMRETADAYVAAVEAHAWDGAWYRRAYYDNGVAMGSAESDDCRIDSIAQSWSVISGAARESRQAQAMQALDAQLVRDDVRLIMLLTPPFDTGAQDPGYIKGYLPGVRENGAQYTHAALWAVMATALRGDGDRAFTLFQMLNPFTHGDTPEHVATYKVEPYVVPADVYAAPGLLGRGGWTWYTGSASWMYRVGLETLLGFTKVGDTLEIVPRVPREWPGYAIVYRFGASTYEIEVRDPAGIQARGARVSIDGEVQEGAVIALVDDGATRRVVVEPPA